MTRSIIHISHAHQARRLFAVALLILAGSISAGTVHAFQIIPSVGFTKSTDANAGDGNFSAGLALRAPLGSLFAAEGGISYREENYSGDDLTVRMWPVSASLWLTPASNLYLGGGLGWYRTTYDYRSELLIEDQTTSDIGLHMGGGVMLPLSPTLGLDFHGRYVFMQANDNIELPQTFDPDFWNASLGLAFKF